VNESIRESKRCNENRFGGLTFFLLQVQVHKITSHKILLSMRFLSMLHFVASLAESPIS